MKTDLTYFWTGLFVGYLLAIATIAIMVAILGT